MVIDTYIGQFINAELLENLINLSVYDEEPLDNKYLKLLNFLLKIPGITAYDIYSVKCTGYKYYSVADRDLKNLLKLNLIAVLEEENKSIQKKKPGTTIPYCLSLNGIFYVILNTFDISSNDLILSLLRNYKENVLFTHFLYPFITEQTLNDSKGDSSIFSIIVSYLRNICNTLINFRYTLKNLNNKTPDGYLKDPIFAWFDNVYDNSNSNIIANVKWFLKWNLKWDKIDNLEIVPKVNNNIIEIIDRYNPQRNSEILILKGDEKAVLRQNGKKLYEFLISTEGPFLSIETKTDRKAIDFMELPLYYRYKEHLICFLTELRTKIIHSNSSYINPIFEILSKDEKYQKALDYLGKELDLSK